MRRIALQQGFLGLDGAAMYLVIAMAVLLVSSWAASAGAMWWLNAQAKTARSEATEAKAAQARETQARQGFQAAGAACSASVDAAKTRADAAEAALEAQAAAARSRTARTQTYIQSLLAAQRPAGLDECQAMQKELNDEIDHRHPGPTPPGSVPKPGSTT